MSVRSIANILGIVSTTRLYVDISSFSIEHKHLGPQNRSRPGKSNGSHNFIDYDSSMAKFMSSIYAKDWL